MLNGQMIGRLDLNRPGSWSNMITPATRPPIPSDVRQVLRQEAGFGCCVCGFPIYDYHHIIPYAVRQHFDPKDMMGLCPNHHREASSGCITQPEQRKYKFHPFNIVRGYVDGKLKVVQSELVVEAGSTQFIRDGFIFLVDTEPLLSLSINSNNVLEISVKLYDQQNLLLASVDRNEWRSQTNLLWDLRYGFQWVTIHQKKHKVALSIDARHTPLKVLGSLWFRQQRFAMSNQTLSFNGVVRNVSFSNLCLVGMYLKADTQSKQFSLVPDERYGKGSMVSEADKEGRIQKGLAVWDEIRSKTS